MIYDKLTEFADSQSVAATAGTANVGNQIDLGAVSRDIGEGQPIYLVIAIESAVVTGGTAGTIAFRLVSDSSASIATDGSATLHWQSKSFVTDDTGEDLTAGKKIVIELPSGDPAYERYLGVQAVVGTTTTTGGTVSAFLSLDKAGWKTYADAVN